MKQGYMPVRLFLGITFFFFICGLVLPDKSFSESENRYLAGKPEFTLKGLFDGTFGTDYEAWLSDQFPARRQFVAVKSNAERLLFKTDVNGVYFGKDQYYIEKFDTETLFTEQLDKNLAYVKTAAEQFAGQLGPDRVKIMLVPSASQILGNRLPAFAAPADQSEVTDKLREQLIRPDMVLSTEEELRRHAEEYIYYKTDHHWTSQGAYYAYRLYGKAAGFTAWPEEDFIKQTVSTDFLGTVESKVQTGMEADDITLFLPKREQEYSVFYDGLPKLHDTLYNETALKKKDQYAVFLDGNHGLTKIVNPSAGTGKRLLLIKDSYAHSFAPFAANHFDEVHMVDLRYFNMPLSAYAKEQEITDILILYQIPGFSKDENIFKIIK